jgi:hypothetical protein
MALSDNELLEQMRRAHPNTHCACGKPASPIFAGKCSDCYYDALSAEIDEHPIGRPRPRGGAVAGE